MKKEFSTNWSASKQRRKQHKYLANAPYHLRHKFLSAHLSKFLREKYSKRNFPLRKGDEVIVMRGEFKKKKAKVASVDIKKTRISLENMQRSKKDGTKVNVYFHPSVLQITSLNLEDKKRIAAIERGKENSGNYITIRPEFSNGQFEKSNDAINRIVHKSKKPISEKTMPSSKKTKEKNKNAPNTS